MKLLLLTILPLLVCGTVQAVADDVPNVTPDQAEQLIRQHPNLVVLDVRTADEFEAGHIAGAQNLDFFGDNFAAQLKALDPSKEYLVHCAAGTRSGKALQQLSGTKFAGLYHMNGGFKAWEQAGKPVAHGK